MANNRVVLRCTRCGERMLISKCYGYDDIRHDAQDYIDFLKEHTYCDKPFKPDNYYLPELTEPKYTSGYGFDFDIAYEFDYEEDEDDEQQ